MKKHRAQNEYCWTCTPSLIWYCLDQYNLDMLLLLFSLDRVGQEAKYLGLLDRDPDHDAINTIKYLLGKIQQVESI